MAPPVEPPAPDPAPVRDLRAALLEADFTVDGLAAVLGPAAGGSPDEQSAALQTAADGPLRTLAMLFLAGARVPVEQARQALPVDAALGLGLLHAQGSRVRAALDLRPHADTTGGRFWVVADLDPTQRVRAALAPAVTDDHVVGIGEASLTLARLVLREPVAVAADVGTGCGIQALHLAGHSERVIATDVSPRAVRLARLTLGLSEVAAEVIAGDLLAPLAGERVDLLVCNPPFAAGPPGAVRYRDSGRAGDAVLPELIAGLPGVLADGGRAQLLGNWLHRRGEDWQDRVLAWVPPGFDAWFCERDRMDPEAYVAFWLTDSGQAYGPGAAAAAERWLSWLVAEQVEAIGFGWVALQAGSSAGASRPPWRRAEELPQAPVGAPSFAVAAMFARLERLRAAGGVASLRLRVADGVGLRRTFTSGPQGWEPNSTRLVSERGLCREADVDDALAALVAGCTGELPAGQVADLLAAALGEPALGAAALPLLETLLVDGFLDPVDDGPES